MNNLTINQLQFDLFACQCRVRVLSLAASALEEQCGEEISMGLYENLIEVSDSLDEISEKLGSLKSPPPAELANLVQFPLQANN